MEHLVNGIIDELGKILLIEQTDGKQYIIRCLFMVSSTERSIGTQLQATEPVEYTQLSVKQFVPAKYKIRPKEQGHMCVYEKSETGYRPVSEYVITIVNPIEYKGEVIGYEVYGSDQEVKRYVKG